MYGLNRLNNLRTLFTAASAHVPRRSPPRSNPFLHASPPASTAGIGYFVGVGATRGRRINDDSFKRKLLPPELSRNVVTLTCESSAPGGICDVYVVGTAHGTMESYLEVQAVMDFLKPQVVFLEYCSSRERKLYPIKPKVPTIGEMLDMWIKNGNLFEILYSWFLAKNVSKYEVPPTSEFRLAYEKAMKYGGKVILGDRPLKVTLGRTWAKMSLWHKTKFLYRLYEHAIFLKIMKITKALEETDFDVIAIVLGEMSKKIPTIMETLIHERDKYMSTSLLKVAREHNSVVAVVGSYHLSGIRKNWKQPIEVEPLLNMPSEHKLIASIFIGAAAVGVAISGFAIFYVVVVVYLIYIFI